MDAVLDRLDALRERIAFLATAVALAAMIVAGFSGCPARAAFAHVGGPTPASLPSGRGAEDSSRGIEVP